MQLNYDIIIIGTGAGGGTFAYALKDSGARILLLERGDYLPQEPENWSPEALFDHKRYKNAEPWQDADGRPFLPACITSSAGTRRSMARPCSGCTARTSAR